MLIKIDLKYRMRAIITRSWFGTAFDYKLRILVPTFHVYVLKWSVILTSLALKNGVKHIQTAGYNGARTVPKDPMSLSSLSFSIFQPRFFWPISHNTLINCHCGQSCPIKRGRVQKRLFHVFSVFIQCGIVKMNVTMTGTSKLTPKFKSLISETSEENLQSSLGWCVNKSWHA